MKNAAPRPGHEILPLQKLAGLVERAERQAGFREGFGRAFLAVDHGEHQRHLAAGIALIFAGLGLLLVDGFVAVALAVLGVLVALGMASFAGLSGSKAAAIWLDNARRTGTLPESMDPNAMSSSCCSAGGSSDSVDVAAGADGGGAAAAATASPASDCGVTGGCGTCSLKGMCAPEGSHQH